MSNATKFAGFYGTTTDGRLVFVKNHGTFKTDGTPAYKVEYCQLGPCFGGGGTLVGQSIHGTKQYAWIPQSTVTRNKKGQNGTIWN